MNIIGKTFMYIKCVCIYASYKVKYKKHIKMSLVNSFRGGVHIELFPNAFCSIGEFLMSRGPLYIKCTEGADIKIGSRCFFNNNCSITAADKIIIGNHCMFANNLVIIDHDHKIENGMVTGDLISKPVIIEDNVWCGANVTILKGVTIGNGAIIAAGAVVTKNVAAQTVVAGVPAKQIESTKMEYK